MVDFQFATAVGTAVGKNIIKAVDAPVLANTSEVETGSTVNGFFCVIEITNTTATSGVIRNAYVIFYKNPGGNITAPVPNTVGSNDDKRYVIHQEMVMLDATENGNPRTLFKGVIVIPKGLRRFGPNDLLEAQFITPGNTSNVCMQAHYKEFR